MCIMCGKRRKIDKPITQPKCIGPIFLQDWSVTGCMGVTDIQSNSEILQEIVTSSTPDWQILTTDLTVLSACVKILQEAEQDSPFIRLLSDRETLKTLEEDFMVAAKARELVESGTLSVRTFLETETDASTLLIGSEQVISLIPCNGNEAVRLTIHDQDSYTRLREMYSKNWETAMPYTFGAPPYSQLLHLAEEKLGSDVRKDLHSAYAAVEDYNPAEQPDPVIVALLVGAKHELLLCKVVDWAESSTLATQGTVSKLKNQLEMHDLISTTSENNGVGRPRQRLIAAEGTENAPSVDEAVSQVSEVLS